MASEHVEHTTFDRFTSECTKLGSQREELRCPLIFVNGGVKDLTIRSTQLINKLTQFNTLSRNRYSLSYTQTSRLLRNSEFNQNLLNKKTLNPDP
jgi:hypothetical protein